MSERILAEISFKMDKLIKLQTIVFLKDIRSEQEKIKALDSLGFKPVEIASLLDKTPDNVYAVLSQLRRRTKPSGNAQTESPIQAANAVVKSSEAGTE